MGLRSSEGLRVLLRAAWLLSRLDLVVAAVLVLATACALGGALLDR